jgi:hypothetical protein
MDISGIPRHKRDNPFNYTDDELAEKALAMEKIKAIYKDVPEYYAEMVYDLCKNTDEAKMEEIKHRIDTTPFKYDYSNLQEELNKVKERWDKEDELISQNLE